MIPGPPHGQGRRGPRRPDPRPRGAAREALARSRPRPDVATLDALELDVLGKKGRLTGVLRGIGALPAEDRPRVGAVANAVRIAIEARARGARHRPARLRARRHGSPPRPSTSRRPAGRSGAARSTRSTRRSARSPTIFGQFGFVVYEGPEIEDDVRNFQMLNIPPDHPARDLWDTLYVDVEGHLLRTHTSPGQIRVMHDGDAADPRAAARAAATATRRSTRATPRSSSRSRA